MDAQIHTHTYTQTDSDEYSIVDIDMYTNIVRHEVQNVTLTYFVEGKVIVQNNVLKLIYLSTIGSISFNTKIQCEQDIQRQ